MPSRIATGPTGDHESIKSLIRTDPSAIEPGLCLLDFDSRTGPSGSLDAVGVDATGRLAIVVVASGDHDAALARVLDGHLWAVDRIDLLGRLYADRGMRADLPARGLLLCPSFSHAFLRRLSLLSVEVVPYLAREVATGDGARLTIIEPAAPLFDLDLDHRPGTDHDPRPEPDRADVREGPSRPERGRDGHVPFWPEGVLPSDEVVTRRGIPLVSDAAEPLSTGGSADDSLGHESLVDDPRDQSSLDGAEAAGESLPEEMPWPASPEERFPWDIEVAIPEDPAVASPPAESLEPAAEFETLTADELEEFERFERRRRGKR